MDIILDARLESPTVPPAFYLSFELEAMSLQCISDMAVITVQAFMTRRAAFWKKPQFYGLAAVLFTLQGVLYGTSNQAIAAILVPGDAFPLEFPDENHQLLNLAFHCSRSYLQLVEEQRASNPTANLTLGFSFWTAMNLVPSPQENENTIPVQPFYESKVIHIKSRQGQLINISRSHWSDMLSSIGYPQRRYIELLPLASQEGAEELHGALTHLDEANALFA